MRNPLFSALILMVLTAAGCGGGGGSSGGSVDCDVVCKKQMDCGTTQSLAECKEACTSGNQIANGSYLAAVQACYAKSCTEVQKCVEGAVLSCDADAEAVFDAYCGKVSDCDSSVSVDACKASLMTGEIAQAMQYLRCLNDDTISKVSSCAEQASCENFTSDSQKCLESQLGVSFTADTMPGGD